MTDVLYTQTFSDSLEMLSQQKKSKFKQFCYMDNVGAGQEAHRMLSQISETGVSKRTQRAENIDNSTIIYDGRWVYPETWHQDTVVDSIDLLRTSINPTGMIVNSFVASLNRQADDDFLSAFYGDAKTGKSGNTTTIFDSNQVVAVTEGVGSATGLNVAKFRELRKILQDNDVDLDFEQAYLAISPQQYKDLTGITEVTSSDFTASKPLQTGELASFLGVGIIVSTRLPVDSNGYRRCPFWVQSGMGCTSWGDITASVRNNPSMKGNPWIVEAEMSLGFTRLEEAKCGEVKCSEA